MSPRPPLDLRPTALAVAAITSLEFGNALARTWFDEVGALGAVALRLAFGALLLLVALRPRVRSWGRGDWGAVGALGLTLGTMNTAFYLAIDRIPLGVAVTIEFTGPLLLGLVLARRARDVGWALLAFAGVALLGFDGDVAASPAGVAFAGVAALCWAGYILASSHLARRVEGMGGIAMAILVAALLVVPVGAGDAGRALARDPGTLVAVFTLVAVLTSAVPYALEFLALRRMSPRQFGVLASLGPAVAALAGWLVLDQGLGPVQLAAMALVTVASIGVTFVRPPVPPAA